MGLRNWWNRKKQEREVDIIDQLIEILEEEEKVVKAMHITARKIKKNIQMGRDSSEVDADVKKLVEYFQKEKIILKLTWKQVMKFSATRFSLMRNSFFKHSVIR